MRVCSLRSDSVQVGEARSHDDSHGIAIKMSARLPRLETRWRFSLSITSVVLVHAGGYCGLSSYRRRRLSTCTVKQPELSGREGGSKSWTRS